MLTMHHIEFQLDLIIYVSETVRQSCRTRTQMCSFTARNKWIVV